MNRDDASNLSAGSAPFTPGRFPIFPDRETSHENRSQGTSDGHPVDEVLWSIGSVVGGND